MSTGNLPLHSVKMLFVKRHHALPMSEIEGSGTLILLTASMKGRCIRVVFALQSAIGFSTSNGTLKGIWCDDSGRRRNNFAL